MNYIEIKNLINNHNSNDYLEIIHKIGLAYDERDLYGDDIIYMLKNKDTDGMWQIPSQINNLLKFLSNKTIDNYLDIGTYNGYTHVLIKSILEKNNKNIETTTIDPFNFINNELIETFNVNKITTTSDDPIIKNNNYDLVFIDGNHDYSYVKNDFYNVGIKSKYCVFHDINDMYIKEKCENGGVVTFWNEIKQNYKYLEFTEHPNNYNIMGIGILIINE